MRIGLVDGIVDNDPYTANAADECSRHMAVLVYNTYKRRESELDSHVHNTHHPTISPEENVVAPDRGFSFFSGNKLPLRVALIQPIKGVSARERKGEGDRDRDRDRDRDTDRERERDTDRERKRERDREREREREEGSGGGREGKIAVSDTRLSLIHEVQGLYARCTWIPLNH